uniref:Monoacylglycerol lipase ABHD12-like n=1 Tax=Phallusia mammillata TaxID=59560 RepID=A0A6F9D673_9ASCI|nr:monoacylglycerol lipase ABHD12-like [Phallusia mammillata]
MIGWTASMISYIPAFLRGLGIIYVIIPMVIQLWPGIVRHVAFLNFLCPPNAYLQLSEPHAWKLINATNIYLQCRSAVHLGVWHLAPLDGSSLCLADAEKVLIYCHGNAYHRAERHRRQLYQLLQDLGFHVISFDYRGFGDSSGTPSEEGIIEDALDVYKWTIERVKNPHCQILVWGHSLGTTVSTQALLKLQSENFPRQPDGLILEAPFTKLLEVMYEYPLSKFLIVIYPKWLILSIIKAAVDKNRLAFNTVECLPKLKMDMLILHAKDDKRVPYQFGHKLYKTLQSGSKCHSCKLVSFDHSHGLGHNECWSYHGFSDIVSDFSTAVKESKCHGFTTVDF